jgi:hypothetical protein
MIKDDGYVIHFNNPKVQASLGSNVFAITGHGETKGTYFFALYQFRIQSTLVILICKEYIFCIFRNV